MSVLIKGMDMPENCALCFLRDDFHNYCPYEKNKETDCPLVEVETPHGRLIDAHETAEKHCSDWCKKKPNCEEDCAVYDTFRYARTVIGSEE